MLRSRNIAKCEQKIVAILKIQYGRHRVFRKKIKHYFSGLVGSQLSKNVLFCKSPKKLNETFFLYIMNWTTTAFVNTVTK